MADQGPSTRPRRSAAVDAQIKVEESYEIWGQPLSDDETRRVTPARKRSNTAESLAVRKRMQVSMQHHNEQGSPTVVPKTEPEDDAPNQPLKRRVGRPRKNPVRQQIPKEVQQATKKITLRVPNSPTFKEALGQIWNSGEDAGPAAVSHSIGHARGLEGITDDVTATSSTQAITPHNNTDTQAGRVPPVTLGPISAERPAQSESSSESSVHDVQVPGILEDATQVGTSGLGPELNEVGSWEGATRFGATQMELEGTPSTPEGFRGGSDHDDWLWQLEANATVQENQHLNTSSSRALPFNSEHAYLVSHPSSSNTPPSLYFASASELHDIVMSTFRNDQQQNPLLGWEPFVRDTQTINKLATWIEQKANSEEKAAISAHLKDTMSIELEKTLAQHGMHPLLYYFRTRAVEQFGCQKMTTMSSAAATSSAFREWTTVQGDDALWTLMVGDATVVNRASAQNQRFGILSRHISSATASSPNAERTDVSSEATPTVAERVRPSKIHRLVLRRRPLSSHPPPMNKQMPSIYFDRNPHGSSIGAHSFDPLVGLPDHSDPRTFHTPNGKDKQCVLDALQPTVDHFRKLTDGVGPRVITLDSGYEVAHILLQADLRLWYVINRPDFAHNNAIAKLFKLERWDETSGAFNDSDNDKDNGRSSKQRLPDSPEPFNNTSRYSE